MKGQSTPRGDDYTTIMSRDEVVQKVFEKYNNKPILDEKAEEILKRNTRRKNGLSDAPSNYREQIRAQPGNGLPIIKSRQSAIREDLVNVANVITPGYSSQIGQIIPHTPIQQPIAANTMKNVSNSYSFGASFFSKKFDKQRIVTMAQSSQYGTQQFYEQKPKLKKNVDHLLERARAKSPPKPAFEPNKSLYDTQV